MTLLAYAAIIGLYRDRHPNEYPNTFRSWDWPQRPSGLHVWPTWVADKRLEWTKGSSNRDARDHVYHDYWRTVLPNLPYARTAYYTEDDQSCVISINMDMSRNLVRIQRASASFAAAYHADLIRHVGCLLWRVWSLQTIRGYSIEKCFRIISITYVDFPL